MGGWRQSEENACSKRLLKLRDTVQGRQVNEISFKVGNIILRVS